MPQSTIYTSYPVYQGDIRETIFINDISHQAKVFGCEEYKSGMENKLLTTSTGLKYYYSIAEEGSLIFHQHGPILILAFRITDNDPSL